MYIEKYLNKVSILMYKLHLFPYKFQFNKLFNINLGKCSHIIFNYRTIMNEVYKCYFCIPSFSSFHDPRRPEV
jgi:hypothetical protein